MQPQSQEVMMVLLASTYDQSKFLRAEDLTQAKKFKIKHCTEEMVGQGADQQKKLVVWFTNSPKGLALNRTNNRTLRGAFGDDTASWKDEVIEVFPTQADFRGRLVGALRVRISPPKQARLSTEEALDAFAANATKPAAAAKPAPAATPEPAADPDLDDEIPF
jgi:hypothetical protein